MGAVIINFPRTKGGRDFLRAAMRAEINNEEKRLRIADAIDWDKSAAKVRPTPLDILRAYARRNATAAEGLISQLERADDEVVSSGVSKSYDL